MVRRTCLRARPRTVDCRGALGELQAISTAPETRHIFDPASDGQAEEPDVGQLAIGFITLDGTLLCQPDWPGGSDDRKSLRLRRDRDWFRLRWQRCDATCDGEGVPRRCDGVGKTLARQRHPKVQL